MANKSLSQLLTDWRQSRQAMETLNNNLPRIIGTSAVKVVKENFKLQGYDSGTGVNGWEARNPKTDKAYDKRHGVKGSVYQSSKPLLEQTRNLYNSVKYAVMNKLVNIGVDLGLIPYAKRMNEGGGGIPPRKYIPGPGEPPNPKILKAIYKKVDFERDKAMNIFKK